VSTLVLRPESASTLPRDLILASAGSGKTFRISSEIIALLARGEAPDEIFASTFTRKAAGEILDRVLVRLAAAALDEGEARELAKHARLERRGADLFDDSPPDRVFWTGVLERTVRRLHRVNVGTLDAFFLRTVTAFAHEVGMPPVWSIADEPTSARLRSLALQDVLREHAVDALLPLIRDISRNPLTRSLHDGLLRRLRTLVAVHHALDPSTEGHWCGFDAEVAGHDTHDFAARRRRLAEHAAAVELPTTKTGGPRTSYANALQKIGEALRQGDWETFLESTLVQRARTGEPFDRVPVPEPVAVLVDEAWSIARLEVAARLAARAHALGEFAELYAAALERRRAAHGAYEFDDITRLLGGADPLADRPDMYYRLDARTKHILLDEFQDTAVPQWQALRPLAEELLSGHAGERAAVIVADPKQSIYGWRGGTPDLVRHLRSSYALTPGELTRSWRSSRVVLDFVNDLYGRLADDAVWRTRPADDEAEVQRHAGIARDWLREFATHEPAKDLPGHVVVRIGPQDEERGEARPQLCRFAAREVARLNAHMPGRSIGVLTRTNAAVARMMLYLKDLGVHASEEGGNPLTDAASVTAVLALLRLCDNPGNTVARYHVARTPLGAAIGYSDHTNDAATLAVASAWRRRLLEEGYGATVAQLAQRVDHACDARERRRLAQLMELAFRFEPDATLRPSDFVHFVRHERVEDPVAANVRVMTVHQSKGLEFDIVVLPELDAPLVQNRYSEVLAYRPSAGVSVRRAFPFVRKALRPLFPDLHELEQATEQAFRNELRDGLSTMYVALTRARHALHVIAKPDQGNSRTGARVLLRALAPGRTEFAEGDIILERGCADWHRSAGNECTPAAQTPAPAATRIELRTSTARTRSLPRRTPSQLEGDGRVDLGMILRLSSAAARGTLVHRWFEHIGWLEDGVPPDDELRSLALTLDASLSAERLDELTTEFRAWLAAPAIAQLLRRSRWPAASSVEREVPFLTREGDMLIEGFIDRLVLTRTNGLVSAAAVIDFKTDAVASTQDVARRTSHYQPQIDAYRRAVAAMYGLAPTDVQGWLVFLEARTAVPA
jgi:ATP-dependent helicase/nuclease subunit A